jgi:hypothetical protein
MQVPILIDINPVPQSYCQRKVIFPLILPVIPLNAIVKTRLLIKDFPQLEL